MHNVGIGGRLNLQRLCVQQLAEDLRERVEPETEGKSKEVVSSVKFLLVL